MNDKDNKLSFGKIAMAVLAIVCIAILVKKGIHVLKNLSQICVVEEGSLRLEEVADAYILREETVLEGENYKNGMVQIIAEGNRVAKNEPAFRYYSNGEDEILTQIETLDNEINAAIESSGLTIFSTDITNLEGQIEKVVDSMYNMNDLEKMQHKMAELNTYLLKKTKITGNLSPANSHIKSLIEKRNALEEQLNNESEVVVSPVAGLISYRVDGLEEILGVNDFSYLNSELLESFDTKSGTTVLTSSEKGKVVNNFECYIACMMDTERASVAKVGDTVTLRLPTSSEVKATIEYIVQEEGDSRVIVFRVTDDVEELVEYRKIAVEVIWWNSEGLKISNSAISEENDISFVERSKAGYVEKIYIKVSRQNDTYSIVENYTDEELAELGFDEDYIKARKELNLYDEILLH